MAGSRAVECKPGRKLLKYVVRFQEDAGYSRDRRPDGRERAVDPVHSVNTVRRQWSIAMAWLTAKTGG